MAKCDFGGKPSPEDGVTCRFGRVPLTYFAVSE